MMRRDYEAQYEQTLLLPPSLEDWVGVDHPARFVRDLVEQLDLPGLGLHTRKSEMGAPCYSRELLLKVWLYGFFEHITTPRQLEKACRNHIGFIWLTAQNYPDHNTLWRFWRDNRDGIKRLFRQTVEVAAKLGLIGLVLHAVDGTRIQSAASADKALYKNKLEKLLAKVEQSIEQYTQAVEAAGQQDAKQVDCSLPERLHKAQQRKQEIKEALKTLEMHDAEHFHPGDPDSEIMPCDRGLRWGYNAQALADEQSGLIVAADVVNQANDKQCLAPMLQQALETIGQVAQTTVADAGYNSESQIGQAAAIGQVLVSEHGQEQSKGRYSSQNFDYDAHKDCYICPEGQELHFCGIDKTREHPRRRYRCRCYKQCPKRELCSEAKGGRSIKRTEFALAVDEHRTRRDLPDSREKLKKRRAIIEHVFGYVKHVLKFRQWTVKGLENVKTQWAMICTSWNLKRMFNQWQKSGCVPPAPRPAAPLLF